MPSFETHAADTGALGAPVTASGADGPFSIGLAAADGTHDDVAATKADAVVQHGLMARF